VKVGGVTLGERLERVAAHRDLVGGGLHLERQSAQDAVVLEQVGQRGVVGQVVHADELDVRAGCEHRPVEVAADPAEAVDANPDGHRSDLLVSVRRIHDRRRSVVPTLSSKAAMSSRPPRSSDEVRGAAGHTAGTVAVGPTISEPPDVVSPG
jgi:hypothetical protein